MRARLTILFYFSLLIAYGQTYFQKIVATNSDYDGEKICNTKDNGYAIAGSTNTSADWDIHLVKLRPDGTMQWSLRYGGPDQEMGYDVAECPDGGLITVGASGVMGTNGPPLFDVYVQKTDSNGALLWAYTYGGPAYDAGYCVTKCKEGGYLIAGETMSFGAGSSDAYLLRIDEAGNLLWTRTVGGMDVEMANSVIEVANGDFVFTGAAGSFKNENSSDLYLVRLDTTGTVLWTRTFGGSGYYGGFSVIESSDKGFVVAGETDKGTGNLDAFLVKADSAGNKKWSKAYGSSSADRARDIVELSPGQYTVIGSIGNLVHAWPNTLLFKVDTDGSLAWSQKFEGNGPSQGNSLIPDRYKGYIISGFARDSTQQDVTLNVSQVDSAGNANCISSNVSVTVISIGGSGSGGVSNSGGIQSLVTPAVNPGFDEFDICSVDGIRESKGKCATLVYPNPGNGVFYFVQEARELDLTDGYGSLVIRAQHLTRLDLSDLLPGVYFASITTKEGIMHQKLILTK